MQDIMERLGLPPDNMQVMDNNQAAIALAMAMQKARAEDADRQGVKQEARIFGASKLDSLRRKLVPLYAAIPRDVEFLELGILQQDKPRLFVDVLAFVEMTRDQLGFRLVQETRAGRVTLAETQDEGAMVEAVTAYIARRLIDRERAMAVAVVAPVTIEPAALQRAALTTTDQVASGKIADAVKANDTPLTAEQAFRQWSRGNPGGDTPVAVTAQASIPPAETVPQVATSSARVEAPATMVAAKASAVDMRASALASAPTASAPDQTDPDELPRRIPSATSKAVPPMRVSQTGRYSGRLWLWVVPALLIAAALGAAALYLYAASLVQ